MSDLIGRIGQIQRIARARRIAGWAVPMVGGYAHMAFEAARNAWRARKAWKKYATPMRPGAPVPAPIGYPTNNRDFGYARSNKKYPLTKVNNSLVPYKNTSLSIFQGGSKASAKMGFGRYRRTGRSALYKKRLRWSASKTSKYQTLTRKTVTAVPITYANTNVYGAGTFALNQCPEYSSMVGMFQEYKIKHVGVKFEFDRIGVMSEQDGDVAGMIPFATVIDTNDATLQVGVTFQDIMNHSGSKTGMAFNGDAFYLSIKPKFINPIAAAGGASASYIQPSSGWLMTGVTDTPHYGYKYAIQKDQLSTSSSTNHMGHMYITTTYTIQFRKRH